ncbi:hypothetical protein, partial [Saccharopolyspora sp. NPDC002686]|uniref:hypothetical protein n=1 Tax=Saccharopolyspora sp. NPDC002686 TaxID=3154541 RepID=UPI0033221BFC
MGLVDVPPCWAIPAWSDFWGCGPDVKPGLAAAPSGFQAGEVSCRTAEFDGAVSFDESVFH